MKKPEFDIWFTNEILDATSCRVYKRRWLMLFLFVVYAAFSLFHWFQYASISEIVVKFYDASYKQAEWTATVFLIAYLLLSWSGWIMAEELGLRWSIITGMIGTCMAAWMKVIATTPDTLWVVMLAQAVAGISQVMLVPTPAILASTWFGPNEVSTACGIGILGILIGVTLGLVLPDWFLHTKYPIEGIKLEMQSFNLGVAIASCLVLILLMRWMEAYPPVAPSPAQMRIAYAKQPFSIAASLKRLMGNPWYCTFLISYSIVIASMCAILSLIKEIIWDRYAYSRHHAGMVILVIVLSGMLGCVISGVVLDKLKKFKVVALTMYMVSFTAMICFTIAIMESLVLIYITAAVLAFSMSGMLTIGHEVVSELTYPEPQSITCGLLAAASQALGILFTWNYSYLLYNVGDTFANLIISGALLVGALLIILIPQDYKRQAVQNFGYSIVF